MFEAISKVMEKLPMNFTKAIHFEEGKRMKVSLFKHGTPASKQAVLFSWSERLFYRGTRNKRTAFLKGMRAGKKGADLLKVLLDGRSWKELEGDNAAAWRSKGIKLEVRVRGTHSKDQR